MSRVQAWPEAEVPGGLRRQVRVLQDLAWPPSPGDREGHDPALAPVSLLLIEGDVVVAALDVLSKRLVHAGRPYAASGLSTVVTDPARRGEGHGSRLVRAAYAHVAASGADIGLFTCDPPLQAFYERAGWRHLPGTVLVGGTPADPLASDLLGKVTLGAAFGTGVSLDPFLGARVALHPGTLDRLW